MTVRFTIFLRTPLQNPSKYFKIDQPKAQDKVCLKQQPQENVLQPEVQLCQAGETHMQETIPYM